MQHTQKILWIDPSFEKINLIGTEGADQPNSDGQPGADNAFPNPDPLS